MDMCSVKYTDFVVDCEPTLLCRRCSGWAAMLSQRPASSLPAAATTDRWVYWTDNE